MPETIEKIESPFLTKLKQERKSALDYQRRRHEQWNENYELYRDFVQINRLTQRQAVNIPLMKETIKTLMAEMDESYDIVFENLDNNKEQEFVLNEYWTYEGLRVDLETIDIQDKKNVLLYGRSFQKLNFFDGFFEDEVLDIYDILVDPKMKPGKIDSARYIIHQNIFKPLSDILTSDKYSEEGKNDLKNLMWSEKGLALGADNRERLEEKTDRLQNLGAMNNSSLEEILSGSEVIVALTEHYTHKWNEKEKKYDKYVAIVAQDNVLLFEKPLKEVLGVDFWPLITWASDLDVSDVWTDGEADVVRVINKVLNAWISQGVENRTLKNWGMRYYDNSKGFNPQSFTPVPWGWYPVPGNPNDIIKEINIEPLADQINEINWLIGLIEKATATPAVGKGAAEKKQITLGEIQMVLGESKERAKGMAKMYRRAAKERAEKWYKILEANVAPSESVTLYKTSIKGNVFPKEAGIKDWKSEAGYKIKITSTSEQETDNMAGIQKLMAVKREFPNNPVINKITEKRMLEILDITPDEMKEVIAYEDQQISMMSAGSFPMPMPKETPQTQNPETAALQQKVGNLRQLAAQTI